MKPEALVYDCDGTLVEFPFCRFANSSFLRPLFAGFFCRLPAWFQFLLARPTKFFEEAEIRQLEGAKIIIVTARKDTEKSRIKLNFLLKSLGLKPDKIFLRPPSLNPREYKVAAMKKIKKEYEIIGIREDEKRFHSDLAKFGPILNL